MFFNIVIVFLLVVLILIAWSAQETLVSLQKSMEKLSSILSGTSFEYELYEDESEDVQETDTKEEVEAFEEALINERVLERERLFDERILRLKGELGVQERKGEEAVVMHPDIENLPHDSVSTYRVRKDGEEYAQ